METIQTQTQTITEKEPTPSFIWCLFGVLIGFAFTVIAMDSYATYHSFPVESRDYEHDTLLLKCEDQSSEWVPMPVCAEGKNNAPK